jgi:hypothetical protein
MAADDDAQDFVHRTLEERPSEDLPAGAEDRLRQRLDEESPPQQAARKTRQPPAAARRPGTRPRDRARRSAQPKAGKRR